MSRGLGKTERNLLTELAEGNGIVILAMPGMTRSEAESRKRAARSLERKGLAMQRKMRITKHMQTVLVTAKVAQTIDWATAQRAADEAKEAQEKADALAKALHITTCNA